MQRWGQRRDNEALGRIERHADHHQERRRDQREDHIDIRLEQLAARHHRVRAPARDSAIAAPIESTISNTSTVDRADANGQLPAVMTCS